jgi:phage terminase small subunit
VADFEAETHHLELLRRLCEAMDRADEARALLAADGLTTVDRYGQVKPHPAVNIERDARIAIARLIRELRLAGDESEPRKRADRERAAAQGWSRNLRRAK